MLPPRARHFSFSAQAVSYRRVENKRGGDRRNAAAAELRKAAAGRQWRRGGGLRLSRAPAAYRLCPVFGGLPQRRPCRGNRLHRLGRKVAVLGMPFRSGAPHVVQVGPIRAAAVTEASPQFANRLGKIAPHDTPPVGLDPPIGPSWVLPTRKSRFLNARLTAILGDKSLKFGAISAHLRSNCDQP